MIAIYQLYDLENNFNFFISKAGINRGGFIILMS